MLQRGLVRCPDPEGKVHKRFFLGDDSLTKRLSCPRKGDTGRHHIEPHLFSHIDKLEHLEAVHDANHGADRENQLIVVRYLAVEIAVLFLKALPYEAYMDTTD